MYERKQLKRIVLITQIQSFALNNNLINITSKSLWSIRILNVRLMGKYFHYTRNEKWSQGTRNQIPFTVHICSLHMLFSLWFCWFVKTCLTFSLEHIEQLRLPVTEKKHPLLQSATLFSLEHEWWLRSRAHGPIMIKIL